MTAYQTIRRGLQLGGEESLEGKTVFVPGALSASGALMIQMARNMFGATKIISTVSTPKVDRVEEYIPGMVDELHDYTKQRIADVVPKGSVNYVFNTQWATIDDGIQVLDPKAGILVSLTGIPPKATIKKFMGASRFPWWLGAVLDVAQLYNAWKVWGTDIKFEFLSGSAEIREDLEKLGEIVARKQLRPVMRTVDLSDLEKVRDEIDKVAASKGGLGKLVIRID